MSVGTAVQATLWLAGCQLIHFDYGVAGVALMLAAFFPVNILSRRLQELLA